MWGLTKAEKGPRSVGGSGALIVLSRYREMPLGSRKGGKFCLPRELKAPRNALRANWKLVDAADSSPHNWIGLPVICLSAPRASQLIFFSTS
jgi:hypothetical protein